MPIQANWDKFNKDMDARAVKIRKAVRQAMEEACRYVLEQVPPVPSAARKSYPFKSMKQWLFVIWAIGQGIIKVPYRRTNTMARSVTTEVKEVGSSTVGTIGTDVVYAPWVISTEEVGGAGPQSSYHKGTWYTLQEVVRKARDKVVRICNENLSQSLR